MRSQAGRRIELALHKELRATFAEMGKRALAVLEKRKSQWPHLEMHKASDIPPDAGLAHDLAADMTSGLADNLTQSGDLERRGSEMLRLRLKEVCASMNASFSEDLYNKVALEYTRAHAYDRGTLVELQQSVKDLVGNMIADEIRAGHTFDVASENISGFFGDLKDWETLRIARTEMARANTFGSLQGASSLAQEHGFKIPRVYRIEALDCCGECSDAVDETHERVFTMADAMAANEECHPNCRRDWIYEIDEGED